MPRPSESFALVRLSLLTRVERVVRRIALRVPPPVQTLSLSALGSLTKRWPALSRLLAKLGQPAEAKSGTSSESPSPASSDSDVLAEELARLRSADFAARADAARKLARVDDPAVTPALVAALRDTSVEVAMTAAEALAHHPGELAAAALSDVLANREGYFGGEARASAVRALGALLPPGEGAVIANAVSDVDAAVSLAAIATLADRREDPSAEALLALLGDRRNFYLPVTRQAAAVALSRLGLSDDERVRELLRNESDEAVRAALLATTETKSDPHVVNGVASEPSNA